MPANTEHIDQIREFNRFYTVLQGFLNRDYLASGYSVTENRLMFEIWRHPGISANRLIDLLRLDKGYISRLVRGFERKGLIVRQASPDDSRLLTIRLTRAGTKEMERLIAITNEEIRRLIAPLNGDDRDEVCRAMNTVMSRFSGRMAAERGAAGRGRPEGRGAGEQPENMQIRAARAGEPSLVSHFYFRLFERQFDFLPCVEQYFLRAASEVYDDPDGSRIWIIEQDGAIRGSIGVVRKGPHEAQLRLFGTAPELQGTGAGTKLMETAMGFCREREYDHVVLWTIDICQAACHLYRKFGFVMTDTKPNTTWARYSMLEEKWEYRSGRA